MQINEMASSIADQCHVISGVIMVGNCPFEQKSKELLVAWPYSGSSMVLWLQCRRRCPSTANNCRALNASPGRLDSRAATKASDGVLGLNMVVIDERERLLVHHAKLIIWSDEPYTDKSAKVAPTVTSSRQPISIWNLKNNM
nr:hypothetical protein Iba_chr12cCG14920 [Ipomoea batatas]